MLILQGAARLTTALAFAPDGRRLAATGDGGPLELWELPAVSGTTRWTPDAGWTAYPQFTPDGRALYAQCEEHGHVRRDLTTGAVVTDPFQKVHGAFALSADGTRMVATQVTRPGESKYLVICRRVGYRLAPDGTRTERWSRPFPRSTLPMSITPLPRGRFASLDHESGWPPRYELVVGSIATGRVSVRGPVAGLTISHVAAASPGGEWLAALAATPGSEGLASLSSTRIRVLDTATATVVADIPNPKPKRLFTGVAFTADGKYLLATTVSLVRVFAVGSWKCVKTWDWKAGPLTCVAVSADGTLAAAGTKTGTVVVWDLDV